jgi:peptidyl-prolyl cis-trans isomerase B (cyclophilin B)
MANSGPNTNGSQFFLVYKDTILDPKYTIWGKIKSGWPILLRLKKLAPSQLIRHQARAYYSPDGYPVQPVEIKSVTVR